MHTPTKAQFQTVIDNLKSVLPMAIQEQNHFDMMQGTVACAGAICDTVHCIGGWYAIATDIYKDKAATSYSHGAEKMAEDLGFFHDHPIIHARENLTNWAFKNPDIWGNPYGNGMFCDELAYNNAGTLGEAINHLESVRDRLPE
jgi:hypothetical protein